MYSLSKELISKLSSNNIKYCHWKSNINLEKALEGYDDLDLLVHRNNISQFEQLILSLGFKEASIKAISFPGVKHFYGYDSESANILHLHVYYHILTGVSWVKSFELDIVDVLFQNLDLHPSGMPIPKKYIEFVIYIFRIMLKTSSLYENILLVKNHEAVLKELEFLYVAEERGEIIGFLSHSFTNIGIEFLDKCIQAIKKGNMIDLWISGNITRKKLRNFRRHGTFKEITSTFGRFFYQVFNKLFFKQKKLFHTSGKIIVITGLDATGKTTIANEIKRWLNEHFTISLIHVGKPPSAFITLPFNFIIKLFRKIKKSKKLKYSLKKEPAEISLFYAIRQYILSYDRYKLIRKYWKKSVNGELVICDRYPSLDIGVMDSRRLNIQTLSGIKKYLANLEKKNYDSFPISDILFKLEVPVEVAIERNKDRVKQGKESEEFIRHRHAKLWASLLCNMKVVQKHLINTTTHGYLTVSLDTL